MAPDQKIQWRNVRPGRHTDTSACPTRRRRQRTNMLQPETQDLPNPVPAAWQITRESSDPEQLTIRTDSGLPVMLPSFRASEVPLLPSFRMGLILPAVTHPATIPEHYR